MNKITFANMLREFCEDRGLTDPQAAVELHLSFSNFRAWKNGHRLPDAFSVAEIERRIRGHAPRKLAMSGFEFATRVRDYRGRHKLSQAQAAKALGVRYATVQAWEHGGIPTALALPEILSALEHPIDRVALGLCDDGFADTLLSWRTKHGLTQRDAARLLSVSFSAIGMWERRRQTPLPRTLDKIMPILNAPPPTPMIEGSASVAQSPGAPDDFSARLRAWRKASRLGQVEAAELLGLSHKTMVSHYERGAERPLPARRAKIEEIIARPLLTARTHAEISFPQRLRAWRKARGLSALEACAVLGLPRDLSLIAHYERGDMLPRAARLAQIEAVIAANDALPATLAEIEHMKARLARTRTYRQRLEAQMQRAERTIERLARQIERRQREATSLRALLP